MQFMTKISLNIVLKGIFAKLNRYFDYIFSLPALPLPDRVVHFAGRAMCGKCGFSLVEMLMALLVASLLMAALAPVMTRRMADHELKVLSEAANYDKDMVISVFTKDTDFNIPSDANQVRVTLMGAGGAGGDALYGNKTFTSNETFTVPDNVTKIRVFMIGGGGGGASGGVGTDIAYSKLKGTSGSKEFAGNTSANTGVKTWDMSGAKGNVPAVDERCIATNPSAIWTLISDTSKTAKPNDTVVNVKACGGGGGGSNYNGTGGGSGGYVNKQVVIPSSTASVSVTIGGGGGGGGNENENGGGANGAGWGGGGGGSESVSTSLRVANGVNPGGNGGSNYKDCMSAIYKLPTNASGAFSKTIDGTTLTAGSGGGKTACIANYIGATAGGNGSLEGGGGGGGGGTCGCGGGGGGATFFGRYAYSTTTDKDFFLIAPGGGGSRSCTGTQNGITGISGGGGGGGAGGGNGENTVPATGGNLAEGKNGGTSPIGNDNYCAGGGIGTTGAKVSGKNGYMLISWSTDEDILQCSYDLPANGGGGGAGGQIYVGEIDGLSSGEVLNIRVGDGGGIQNTAGKDGNNGSPSMILRGTNPLAAAAGGNGGKFSSDATVVSKGGKKYNTLISGNWLNIDFNKSTNGSDGYLSSDAINQGNGGSGGSVQNIKGEILSGGLAGNGGSTNKDGGNASPDNYGAAGGGGAGVRNTGDKFGNGGAGMSGIVYIEWGGSNGSGGTAGEIIKKTITNLDPDSAKRIMKIKIGKGVSGGSGEITTASIISGGKTVTLEAKGGIRGNNGTMDAGVHGSEVNIPSNFSELYKEYVQSNLNIVKGQKGTNDYGGMGGYLTCLYQTKDEEGNQVCASAVKSNDGTDITLGPVRPGCGGSSIVSPLYDAVCNAKSTSASPDGGDGILGGGGGGGAVLNKTGGSGGKGGDGFVILEYKSTTLD